jgi:hypothetical protein
MVMVLNLGVWSRFLTNNFVDTNVLICGPNVTGVVVVLKCLCIRDRWRVLVLWGGQICGGWLGDAW